MQDRHSSESPLPPAPPQTIFEPNPFANSERAKPLSAATQPASAAVEPQLDLPTKGVSLTLLSAADEAECEFWIGLAKRGPHHPNLLLDLEQLSEIFAKAAVEGLAETGPVMLSDAESSRLRYLYLVPPPHAQSGGSEHQHEAMQAWAEALAQTVAAWAPARVGLYFAPELVPGPACHQLLKALLRVMLPQAPCTQYYLWQGGQGLNGLLNTALTLRQELLKQGVQLAVFHP